MKLSSSGHESLSHSELQSVGPRCGASSGLRVAKSGPQVLPSDWLTIHKWKDLIGLGDFFDHWIGQQQTP